ncbi:MAG: glutamine--tRNA ligase/YqeY domain fusion protein [Sporomusaceae bacterium]|jgi:glutaminyl-tRNA synthetase|nr:glutamine--tRNA ligase/YqeY domain fusion protein [Sporomusaceae bacterium]
MPKENENVLSKEGSSNFIENIIGEYQEKNPNVKINTRFPPEPNGYLHIGHAKSICLNFGLALKYGGWCNLRFDDTNPSKEEEEYVNSIVEDVKWLGFDWGDRLYYASDYFDKLYACAVELIKKEKAYVCDLSAEQIREYRGSLTSPGKESPCRNRSAAENLELFAAMKNGEFADGSKVLRAKIDMASPNLNLRDPVLYRIMRSTHHRTGDQWVIYPMYDYAHPISDALENITHSICTLEFEDHRPLYDWLLNNLGLFPSRQYEFARLNLTNTIMSKRYLRQLVEEGVVSGWNDPRMPTISGLRRRGVTKEAIRDFCERIGVAKSNSTIEMSFLEHCVREDLSPKATRVMAVLRPLKVVIENYPAGQTEELSAENNPENPETGSRTITFSREIYIEQEDFCENPPKKYFRLTPGAEVRLKHAYIIKCEQVIKDETTGEISEVRCTYDPETKSGSGFSARKVKGTIHWVDKTTALPAEARLYDHLITDETAEKSLTVNPNSLTVLKIFVEPSLKNATPQDRFQFIRNGYFCLDSVDSQPDNLVFNRIVSLKDSWAKVVKADINK